MISLWVQFLEAGAMGFTIGCMWIMFMWIRSVNQKKGIDECPPETGLDSAYEDGYDDGYADGMAEAEKSFELERELDERDASYVEAKIPDRAPDE